MTQMEVYSDQNIANSVKFLRLPSRMLSTCWLLCVQSLVQAMPNEAHIGLQ